MFNMSIFMRTELIISKNSLQLFCANDFIADFNAVRNNYRFVYFFVTVNCTS